MTRHRTTQIKPATRDALKDQFALAADTIEREREANAYLRMLNNNLFLDLWRAQSRWWHRYAWWRA